MSTNTDTDPVAEAAADAALAVFDRALELMAPPRHLVAEALEAAAGVYVQAQEVELDRLMAGEQFAGMDVQGHDVQIRLKHSSELLRGIVAAFDTLMASSGARNYTENEVTITGRPANQPRWVEQETTYTDPDAIPRRRYHVIVVKPDGKSPHTLRQEAEARADAAEQRADRAEAQLAEVRAAGVDPHLLRWCGWPGCWRSYNAVTGPAERGWMRTRLAAVTLCPTHDPLGHQPAFDWNREAQTTAAVCSCGAREQLPDGRTSQHAVEEWWAQHVQALALDVEDLPDARALAVEIGELRGRIAAALALVAGGMPVGPRNLRVALLDDVECACEIAEDGQFDWDPDCGVHGSAPIETSVMAELLGQAREATMWTMGAWVDVIERAPGERTHYDGLLANVLRAVLDFMDRPAALDLLVPRGED